MLAILFIFVFYWFLVVCLIFLVCFSVRLSRYITVGFILGLCYFDLLVFCVWVLELLCWLIYLHVCYAWLVVLLIVLGMYTSWCFFCCILALCCSCV